MFKSVFIVVVVILLCSQVVSANLIQNGGFETGGFTGWNSAGDISVVGSIYGSGPIEGAYQAVLSTSRASSAENLETFLGLSTGTLNTLTNPAQPVFGGSAIKQTFVTTTGGTVSFAWNFLTDEPGKSIGNDFAFVTLDNQLLCLANTYSTLTGSSTLFVSETGFNSMSLSLGSPGLHTVAFGVVNVLDDYGDSGLLIDGVSAHVVPLPSSLLLILTGLIGTGFARKQFNRFSRYSAN